MTTPPDDPRADEGLVEAMAIALFYTDNPKDHPRSASWHSASVQMPRGVNQHICSMADWYRELATAALAAARSHGGM